MLFRDVETEIIEMLSEFLVAKRVRRAPLSIFRRLRNVPSTQQRLRFGARHGHLEILREENGKERLLIVVEEVMTTTVV